jgi:hypothetical protein
MEMIMVVLLFGMST